jgi:nicotinamide-nucleotide amidase
MARDTEWRMFAWFNGMVGVLAMTGAMALTLFSLWLYLRRYGGARRARAKRTAEARRPRRAAGTRERSAAIPAAQYIAGMNLEIVTIGDELLLGFTNRHERAHLAREFSTLGIRSCVAPRAGDDPDTIASAVRDALDRTGAVITTGGLGPTADDMTSPRSRERSAAGWSWTGDPGRAGGALGEALRARAAVSNRQQALVPEGATILPNRHGSAPGIWLEDQRGPLGGHAAGVPREMRGMLADTLMPRLRDRVGAAATVVRSRTLRTANIAESALADRLGEHARGVPAPARVPPRQ